MIQKVNMIKNWTKIIFWGNFEVQYLDPQKWCNISSSPSVKIIPYSFNLVRFNESTVCNFDVWHIKIRSFDLEILISSNAIGHSQRSVNIWRAKIETSGPNSSKIGPFYTFGEWFQRMHKDFGTFLELPLLISCLTLQLELHMACVNSKLSTSHV